MSGAASHVAAAALPVAAGLLACAAAARAAVWAQVERARDVAQEHLEPLTTWCLGAVAVHVLALAAAGDASVAAMVLPFVIAAGALLASWESDRTQPTRSAPAQMPAASSAVADQTSGPVASLWTDWVEDRVRQKRPRGR